MRTIILSIFISIPIVSFGQQIEQSVIGTAGSEDISANASISWTVGEVVTETLSTANVVLTQGFHQGNLTISSIAEKLVDFTIRAYPNPVKDILILETQEQVKYQIINMNGKVLQNGSINSNQKEIDFTHFPSGIYFLQVAGNKTHKIVKQ